jgi:hypothetical protein
MTPSRLSTILAALRWGTTALAAELHCTRTLTGFWVSGHTDIPEPVAEWLEARHAAVVGTPPPDVWRSGRGRRAGQKNLSEHANCC